MKTVEVPAKLYFRIGEVARLLELPTHVLRFWETEFRGVRPQKSRAGQRVYSRKDVEKLVVIRRLLREERYTLEGARKYLREKGMDVTDATAPARPERLRGALEAARDALREALVVLDGPSANKSSSDEE
ncbi:MAG: MerR family transcriptional regulator [Polyangiales bacterium]